MPIRKVKGRSRAVKRRPAAEKGGGPEVRAMPEPEQLEDYGMYDLSIVHVYPYCEGVVVERFMKLGSADEAKRGVEEEARIQEARSTIERLARKYLVSS